MNEPEADRATFTSGLLFGKCEVLGSLRHKNKDIAPSIACGIETRKRAAVDDVR